MVGEILEGKYRIEKQLVAGGMGKVYLATHLGTTRVVAVKVIAPRWASDPHFLGRLQREAQACGRLRDPNIINVTGFGVARSKSGAQVAYLVMEYLDGQTVSDFQEEHPRVALPLMADLLDQVALALTEAHRHGIVHRDLKPDNIWLESNGRGSTVKVLDFAAAKVNLLREWGVPDTAAEEKNTPTNRGMTAHEGRAAEGTTAVESEGTEGELSESETVVDGGGGDGSVVGKMG